MTNLEYIEKTANCNDMACIYAQVFGCKNERTLTPFWSNGDVPPQS